MYFAVFGLILANIATNLVIAMNESRELFINEFFITLLFMLLGSTTLYFVRIDDNIGWKLSLIHFMATLMNVVYLFFVAPGILLIMLSFINIGGFAFSLDRIYGGGLFFEKNTSSDHWWEVFGQLSSSPKATGTNHIKKTKPTENRFLIGFNNKSQNFFSSAKKYGVFLRRLSKEFFTHNTTSIHSSIKNQAVMNTNTSSPSSSPSKIPSDQSIGPGLTFYPNSDAGESVSTVHRTHPHIETNWEDEDQIQPYDEIVERMHIPTLRQEWHDDIPEHLDTKHVHGFDESTVYYNDPHEDAIINAMDTTHNIISTSSTKPSSDSSEVGLNDSTWALVLNAAEKAKHEENIKEQYENPNTNPQNTITQNHTTRVIPSPPSSQNLADEEYVKFHTDFPAADHFNKGDHEYVQMGTISGGVPGQVNMDKTWQMTDSIESVAIRAAETENIFHSDFIASPASGKVHHISCNHVNHNMIDPVYFENVNHAMKSGFTPCNCTNK